MDYKNRNRIPGYRPPRTNRKKSRAGWWAGLSVAAALAAVAAGWVLTRPKDAAQPPKPEAPKAALAAPLALPNPAPKPADKKPAKADPKDPAKPGAEAPPRPVEVGPVKPPEPRFTFYKILPELEAIVPESEIKNLKREESLGKKPQAVKYLLQAGSFTSAQDAEKLKARLSALKIKSHIETVKIENTAWNRVKIGPFNNMADADRVRVYLRGNQLDSVVQKAVGPGAAAQPSARR